MNIKTPFVLLNLDKKEIINRLKEKNIKYKIEDYFIKFYQIIDEFNLTCEVSVYCICKKVNSISYSYIFDKDIDNESVFKQIESIKEVYKNEFDVESYFDPKDGKSFEYRLSNDIFGIYLHGTSYYTNETDKHIGIAYGRKSKNVATSKKSIKEKKLLIKDKYIKKIDKYANNDNLNKWYGLCLNIKNSKGKSSPVRVDALEDKLIVYYMNKFKINTFEIEYNKIKRYDLYEDFVYISYDDKRFMYTIIENDVSKFNNIICDKIGYNSKKYNELNKIISEAFIEYDVFNNSSSKKEIHQRYINETTKALFKVEDLNNEIMYNILQGIDFDMYFYFEWKNFANYLYNKLKEHNYF
jgi:hypothetical protein